MRIFIIYLYLQCSLTLPLRRSWRVLMKGSPAFYLILKDTPDAMVNFLMLASSRNWGMDVYCWVDGASWC